MSIRSVDRDRVTPLDPTHHVEPPNERAVDKPAGLGGHGLEHHGDEKDDHGRAELEAERPEDAGEVGVLLPVRDG